LNDEQKTQVMVMLDCSPTLSSAYFIKEDFFKFYKSENIETCKKDFFDWIEYARESDIKSFVKCAKTFENWSSGILNSLKIPLTNGFTEGCNNKIKVLKRNAYGYRNFNRFRNRILFMFDK
ncbi:MAG: transposase, partial [Clostridia bacterium]